MKNAVNGHWKPAAVTFCAPTGRRTTRKHCGMPTSSLRKWRTLFAQGSMIWECGPSSIVKKADPSPYPCLLLGVDDVAGPSAMDEGIGAWHSPKKTAGGITGIEAAGRASADKGENPQV